jgi:hypothetical protein
MSQHVAYAMGEHWQSGRYLDLGSGIIPKPWSLIKCPFVNLPETRRPRWGEILDAEKMKKCVWVRPKLVAVVEFLEWTEADRLRHSTWRVLAFPLPDSQSPVKLR